MFKTLQNNSALILKIDKPKEIPPSGRNDDPWDCTEGGVRERAAFAALSLTPLFFPKPAVIPTGGRNLKKSNFKLL
jgi:hypothetical protein